MQWTQVRFGFCNGKWIICVSRHNIGKFSKYIQGIIPHPTSCLLAKSESASMLQQLLPTWGRGMAHNSVPDITCEWITSKRGRQRQCYFLLGIHAEVRLEPGQSSSWPCHWSVTAHSARSHSYFHIGQSPSGSVEGACMKEDSNSFALVKKFAKWWHGKGEACFRRRRYRHLACGVSHVFLEHI